jgi:hypothetical protein
MQDLPPLVRELLHPEATPSQKSPCTHPTGPAVQNGNKLLRCTIQHTFFILSLVAMIQHEATNVHSNSNLISSLYCTSQIEFQSHLKQSNPLNAVPQCLPYMRSYYVLLPRTGALESSKQAVLLRFPILSYNTKLGRGVI